jgi:hypothetical protein
MIGHENMPIALFFNSKGLHLSDLGYTRLEQLLNNAIRALAVQLGFGLNQGRNQHVIRKRKRRHQIKKDRKQPPKKRSEEERRTASGPKSQKVDKSSQTSIQLQLAFPNIVSYTDDSEIDEGPDSDNEQDTDSEMEDITEAHSIEQIPCQPTSDPIPVQITTKEYPQPEVLDEFDLEEFWKEPESSGLYQTSSTNTDDQQSVLSMLNDINRLCTETDTSLKPGNTPTRDENNNNPVDMDIDEVSESGDPVIELHAPKEDDF